MKEKVVKMPQERKNERETLKGIVRSYLTLYLLFTVIVLVIATCTMQ